MKTIIEAQNRAMFLFSKALKEQRDDFDYTPMRIKKKKSGVRRGIDQGKVDAYGTMVWDLMGNTFTDTYWQNVAINLEVEQIKTGLPLMVIIEDRDNWKPVTTEDAVKYIQGKHL